MKTRAIISQRVVGGRLLYRVMIQRRWLGLWRVRVDLGAFHNLHDALLGLDQRYAEALAGHGSGESRQVRRDRARKWAKLRFRN